MASSNVTLNAMECALVKLEYVHSIAHVLLKNNSFPVHEKVAFSALAEIVDDAKKLLADVVNNSLSGVDSE
ncbi:hypothetical protein KU92_25005 [Salmonella enterica]|nr:hypothetical protein [Salmonella enterica]EDC0987241.1 hypothetical protein [Salmonella enterica subsp. enterica serovar Give]